MKNKIEKPKETKKPKSILVTESQLERIIQKLSK
jgi:hypothetical protein